MKRTLLGRIKAARQTFRTWQPQTLDELDNLIDRRHYGLTTYSGVDVDEILAMNVAAVWCAVQNISQSVASLPLKLYQRVGETGKKPYPRHPLYNLLHDQPNEQMSSYVWRERAMHHLLLWGNHYSEIFRSPSTGRVTSIYPFNNPGRMRPQPKNGRLRYVYKLGDGKEKIYQPEQIFHLAGLGFDGRVGYSVIAMARNTIGSALASDEFAGKILKNPIPPAVLKTPNRFHDREAAHNNIRQAWEKTYGGVGNTGKIAILEEGLDFQEIGMSPEDMQLLTTRIFNVQEIARWFNIPPHKLKEMTNATYSNIEHQQIEYVQDTVRPWLARWEAEIHRQLLNQVERKKLFAEYNMNALMRGDSESRSKFYTALRNVGVVSADEIREWENMNPLGGRAGDIVWMPMNMTDASSEPVMPVSTEGAGPPQEEEEEGRSVVEERAFRSVVARKKVAEAYKEKFRAATRAIVKRDKTNILKITKANFQERGLNEFDRAVDEYYNKSFDYVRKQFSASYLPFSADIYGIAAEEVNTNGKPTDEFQTYTSEFVDKASVRYVGEKRNEIKKLAHKAQDSEEDISAAVEKRIQEWEEKQPDKVANRETVDGESGLAQFVYFANGFQTRWVTLGDSCPYCTALNGRVISRGGAFLNAGEAFEPVGAVNGPLRVHTTISHPAAHQGCDCTVSATMLRSVRDKIDIEVPHRKPVRKKIKIIRDEDGNIANAEIIEGEDGE